MNLKNKFLTNMFRPNIVPVMFVFAVSSLILGVCFMLGIEEAARTVLHSHGILFGIQLWGTSMTTSAFIALLALMRGNYTLARWAAFWQSTLWIFAAITYIEAGSFMNLFVVAITHILVWSYFYVTIESTEPLDVPLKT